MFDPHSYLTIAMSLLSCAWMALCAESLQFAQSVLPALGRQSLCIEAALVRVGWFYFCELSVGAFVGFNLCVELGHKHTFTPVLCAMDLGGFWPPHVPWHFNKKCYPEIDSLLVSMIL